MINKTMCLKFFNQSDNIRTDIKEQEGTSSGPVQAEVARVGEHSRCHKMRRIC
jgi:hypothetical protein